MTLRKVLVVALLAGCGSEEEPTPTWTCGDCCVTVDAPGAGEACAGVVETRLCDGDACVPDGADCASTIEAAGGGRALLDAATEAASGDCIAVGAGTYDGPVTLRAGVAVFGVGVEWTTVQGGLAFEPGGGARVRGLHIVGGRPGLELSGTTGALVEQSVIEGATLHGVRLFNASGARLTNLLVQGTVIDESQIEDGRPSQQFGIGLRASASSVALDHVLLRDNAGYGAALTLDGAAETPEIVFSRSRIEGSGMMGIDARGVNVALDGTEVRTTRLGGESGGYAYLLLAADGAALAMTGSSLRESELVGLYVYGEGNRGTSVSAVDCELTGSPERAVWLQAIGDPDDPDATSALFEDTVVSGNVMGYGGWDAYGVVIQAGIVSRTGALETVCGTSSCAIADGAQVLAGSQFAMEGVTFEQNERAAIVIDGAGSGGSCTDCIVDRGGGQYGIVIQAGAPVPPLAGSVDTDGAQVEAEERADGDELPVAAPLGEYSPPDEE